MKNKNQTIMAMRKLLPRDVANCTGPWIDVYIHASVGNSMTGEAKVTIAEKNYGKNEDIRHEFTLPVRVIPGWKGKARRCSDGIRFFVKGEGGEVYRPCGGYFKLDRGRFASAIHSIPADAEIRLVVGLDLETNGYMAEHGLHGDVVDLAVQYEYRGKPVKQTFRIGSECQPHNSARFGSPGSGIGAYEEHIAP